MNIEDMKKVIAEAPRGSTHIDFNGMYLKYDLNKELELYHVNYKEWQWASRYICPYRSLSDIKTIIDQYESYQQLLSDYNDLMESSHS